ncbi:hypothetical protein JCM6882_002340 [Rhodosporidiobolus microsporus]
MTVQLVPAPAAPTLLTPDATTADKLARLAKTKRAVVGSVKAKEAVLKSGEVASLVSLLYTSPEPPSDETLAVSAEAANVLAALSLPNLTAVSILLSSSAHRSAVLALSSVLHTALNSPHSTPATQHKLLESHLRAVKSLYTDLVKVVGPREWGTEVVGASIDAEERRDAEGLWLTQTAAKGAEATNGKGKGKETEEDTAMRGVEGGAPVVNLVELKTQAQAALELVFLPRTPSPAAGPSSSSSPSSSALLPSLIDLLADCASPSDSSSAVSAPLPQWMRIADLICTFLAGTVRQAYQRAAVLEGEDKGRKMLVALRSLAENGSDKVKESALKALAVLVRDSPTAMLILLNLGTTALHLAPFTALTLSPLPGVRLAAASLLSVIAKIMYPPTKLHIPEGELGPPLVTVLLGLIEKERELRARAAFAFAYLIADEPILQVRAIAALALPIFHDVLSQPILLHDQPYPTPAALEEDARVREGILLSIASLAALFESHRRHVLDASLLPPILSALSHPTVGVRAAGCHCVRALSRSVNILRTDLVEARAEESLVRLLREEENEVVKVTASAAVANLLLEFSPMRTVLVEAGCIPRMCSLAIKSSNPTLRLNALWAIRNATYQSSAEFKRSVLQHLTWENLASLISSPSAPISDQSLGILRNITCVTQNEAITGLSAERGELGEERLLGLLEGKVAAGVAVAGGSPAKGVISASGEGEEGVVQALYCLNNIATAHEAAQLAIASRTTLLRYILSYLDSRSLALRTASLWVLHNLIYRRGPSSSSSFSSYPSLPPSSLTDSATAASFTPRRPSEIVDKLNALGLEAKLRMLERDVELDVRERVKDLREAMA